jgi:hypothetical protein
MSPVASAWAAETGADLAMADRDEFLGTKAAATA